MRNSNAGAMAVFEFHGWQGYMFVLRNIVGDVNFFIHSVGCVKCG